MTPHNNDRTPPPERVKDFEDAKKSVRTTCQQLGLAGIGHDELVAALVAVAFEETDAGNPLGAYSPCADQHLVVTTLNYAHGRLHEMLEKMQGGR